MLFFTEPNILVVVVKNVLSLDFQAKVCKIISSGKSPRLSPKFQHLQDSRGLEPFHLNNYELGLVRLEVQGHRISKVDQQIA